MKHNICNYHKTNENRIWNPFKAQFWKQFNHLLDRRNRGDDVENPDERDRLIDLENFTYPKTACWTCVEGKMLLSFEK